jgi:predicted metal-dependent RNase
MNSVSIEEADAIVQAARKKKEISKQSEATIYNNCKKKYQETNKLLEQLAVKKKKIEDEISHLQQKQADRKKFLEEVYQRHHQS